MWDLKKTKLIKKESKMVTNRGLCGRKGYMLFKSTDLK